MTATKEQQAAAKVIAAARQTLGGDHPLVLDAIRTLEEGGEDAVVTAIVAMCQAANAANGW